MKHFVLRDHPFSVLLAMPALSLLVKGVFSGCSPAMGVFPFLAVICCTGAVSLFLAYTYVRAPVGKWRCLVALALLPVLLKTFSLWSQLELVYIERRAARAIGALEPLVCSIEAYRIEHGEWPRSIGKTGAGAPPPGYEDVRYLLDSGQSEPRVICPIAGGQLTLRDIGVPTHAWRWARWMGEYEGSFAQDGTLREWRSSSL